jgi:hypothetical protein
LSNGFFQQLPSPAHEVWILGMQLREHLYTKYPLPSSTVTVRAIDPACL